MIGRLNVGGPSIQAITLSHGLDERGYATVLVCGREGPHEGTMDHLARDLQVAPLRVNSLRREFGAHDLVALMRTVWLLARVRPAILHTHAAKAGAIGRAAALLLGPIAPRIRIHTFHGHVLTGYFSRRQSEIFLRIERFLAARSTVLVAVSEEVRDDLVRLAVAPGERIEVVPLGFDLTAFEDDAGRAQRRAAFRGSLGIGAEELVVVLVARLVAIKRVDRFLRVAKLVHDAQRSARFVVVGDGELREALRSSAETRALGDRVIWAGMRLDMPAVYAGSDVVALTSDNEGTPVSLIEAHASGLAAVATRVGGVSSVVLDGVTGWTVAPDDDAALARAIVGLLGDSDLRETMGRRGREHVQGRFRLERLLEDIDRLYRRLLQSS